jgi:hypothetical protein
MSIYKHLVVKLVVSLTLLFNEMVQPIVNVIANWVLPNKIVPAQCHLST